MQVIKFDIRQILFKFEDYTVITKYTCEFKVFLKKINSHDMTQNVKFPPTDC